MYIYNQRSWGGGTTHKKMEKSTTESQLQNFLPLGPLRPISPGGPLRPGKPRGPSCPGKPFSPAGPGAPGGPGRPGRPGAPNSGLLRLAASWASCSVMNRRTELSSKWTWMERSPCSLKNLYSLLQKQMDCSTGPSLCTMLFTKFVTYKILSYLLEGNHRHTVKLITLKPTS